MKRKPLYNIGDSVLILGTGSWGTDIKDVISNGEEVIYKIGMWSYIYEEKIMHRKSQDWSGVTFENVIEPYDTFTVKNDSEFIRKFKLRVL